MSTDSKREQIIIANKTLVESVSSITSVVRTWQSHSDLESFAVTQFPVCAIIGRMPKFLEKKSNRVTNVDQIISELKVDILTYVQVNENMDTSISNICDDLFQTLYTDQERGGLVFDTVLELDENQQVWPPFAAFKITAIHRYIHDTTGI